MFTFYDPHQFFKEYDDNEQLIYHWSMDKIKRTDGKVWVINHMFIAPNQNKEAVLDKNMALVMEFAKNTKLPIWTLDPLVIDYFQRHPEFHKIWYHRPAQATN